MNNVMNKEEAREFLRICKSCDFIKFNTFLKDKNISQPAFSRFLSDTNYSDMISEKKVLLVAEELYSSAMFLKDIYESIENRKKVA